MSEDGAPTIWRAEISEIADVLTEADARGLRRALVVFACPVEVQAVRAHLRPPCALCRAGREELLLREIHRAAQRPGRRR